MGSLSKLRVLRSSADSSEVSLPSCGDQPLSPFSAVFLSRFSVSSVARLWWIGTGLTVAGTRTTLLSSFSKEYPELSLLDPTKHCGAFCFRVINTLCVSANCFLLYNLTKWNRNFNHRSFTSE